MRSPPQPNTHRLNPLTRLVTLFSVTVLVVACGGGSSPSGTNAEPSSQSSPEIVDAGTPATGAASNAVNAPSTGDTNNVTDETDTSGVSSESSTLTVPTTETSPVQNSGTDESNTLDVALVTGDSAGISEQLLLDAAIETAEQLTHRCESVLSEVYSQGLVDATMPYLSNHVYSYWQNNIPLHVAGNSGAVYSWLGEHKTGSRYAYFGAGIFTESDSHYWGNLGNELALNTSKVLQWITRSRDTSSSAPIRVLALSTRAGFQMENWLTSRGLNQDWTVFTDLSLLESGDYDVLAGLAGGDLPEVPTALASGKAIIIWSEVFNPGAGIQQLGLNWNWWGEDTVGNMQSVAEQCSLAYFSGDIQATLDSLKRTNLNFDYSDDACTTSLYTTTCSPDIVMRDDGVSMQDSFMSGAEELQRQIASLDAKGQSVFDQSNGETLLKLAVLLGDQFRGNISYPMDHLTTPDQQFYQALFADYTNHYARTNNHPQTHAGDYSEKLDIISMLKTEPGVFSLQPTLYSEWNSTGYTAKPGEPVTLTRTDNNPATVSVRFNMLRSQATWIWNSNGYTRPLFTSSHPVTLPANSSVTLSSPIGGPVYVHWDANLSDVSSSIDIGIEGAAKHPILQEFSSSSIESFANMLEKNEFDWIDIKTPAVEVHSRADLLEQALNQEDGNEDNSYTQADVQRWINNLDTYLIGSALSLAGFETDSVAGMNENVAAFCTDNGLDCADKLLHRKPPLQHINSDLRASCGDLCSGNPFDSNSSINPLGYGESHEMGHNLQRARFNFYAARSLEASNNIFPIYSAWLWLQNNTLSRHPTIRLPDPEKTFEQLQQSISFNSQPGIGHPIWLDSQIYVNADVRFMLYLQLMFIHHQWEKDIAAGATGWDIFTKLYKLERQFDQAVADEQEWLNQRNRLGFSNYDRGVAQSISGNDFMAVALSMISKRDHTDYLLAWGLDISLNAQSQIQSNGTVDSIPMTYWRTPDDRFLRIEIPSDDPNNALPLDGVTQW